MGRRNMNRHTQTLDDGAFCCSICYELASNPVTTRCGHLFCYRCISSWFAQCDHTTCPVCKKISSRDSLIPIYTNCDKHEMDLAPDLTTIQENSRKQQVHIHLQPFPTYINTTHSLNTNQRGFYCLLFVFLLVALVLPW